MRGTGRTLAPWRLLAIWLCTGPIRAQRGYANHRHKSHHSQSAWEEGGLRSTMLCAPNAACWLCGLLSMHTAHVCFVSPCCDCVWLCALFLLCYTVRRHPLNVLLYVSFLAAVIVHRAVLATPIFIPFHHCLSLKERRFCTINVAGFEIWIKNDAEHCGSCLCVCVSACLNCMNKLRQLGTKCR